MQGLTISPGLSEEEIAKRAELVRRLEETTALAQSATAVRAQAEATLEKARAEALEAAGEFAAARHALEEVNAALSRSSRDTAYADRRLAELSASEATTQRKHAEASAMASQFKAAEEFTRRSRAAAEEELAELRSQPTPASARIAIAEQRAAEERAAEERAARARAAADQRASEFGRALERLSMERATYQEQIKEQHQARDFDDAAIEGAQAKFAALGPLHTQKADALAAAERAASEALAEHLSAVAHRDDATAEMHAFDMSCERSLVESQLAALRDAEERAARELAEAEEHVRVLQGAERDAALERARLEEISAPAAPHPTPAYRRREAAMPAFQPVQKPPQNAAVNPLRLRTKWGRGSEAPPRAVPVTAYPIANERNFPERGGEFEPVAERSDSVATSTGRIGHDEADLGPGDGCETASSESAPGSPQLHEGELTQSDSHARDPHASDLPNGVLHGSAPLYAEPAFAEESEAAAAYAKPDVIPMRSSSLPARRGGFRLFGWRQGADGDGGSEDDSPSISVADRIARDFGNFGPERSEDSSAGKSPAP